MKNLYAVLPRFAQSAAAIKLFIVFGPVISALDDFRSDLGFCLIGSSVSLNLHRIESVRRRNLLVVASPSTSQV